MNANENGNEVAEVVEPQAEKPKKGKKSKAEVGQAMTLGELSERYLKHLEDSGKSHGTCFSYAIELRTACKVMGSDTLIALLTADDVLRYFRCDDVMRLKNGKPKALPSYLKTQRVLRLALCWAAEKRWIEKAPLPEAETK